MTTRPLFAAIGLACLLAGCTTSGGTGSIEARIAAPPVYVESFGGYDLRGTIPPLEVSRVGNQMQANGRAVMIPTGSPSSVCPSVTLHGCVVANGDRWTVYIDASLPEWARTIYGTGLFGMAAQRATGHAVSRAGWTAPLDTLMRSAGAGSAAGERRAAVLTYAHVWGGEPPEPYASAARRLLASGGVEVRYRPLSQVEDVCGRNHTPSGWIGMACQITDHGRPVVLIANEAPPSARPLLELHEAAHAAGWPEDHPGALKPAGHLDACVRSMTEGGLTLRQMRSLCNLDAGAPLRTADEQARWAAMRAGA